MGSGASKEAAVKAEASASSAAVASIDGGGGGNEKVSQTRPSDSTTNRAAKMQRRESVRGARSVLNQLRLDSEYLKLAENGYETIDDLREMTFEDMVDCGLLKGHARRIVRYFSEEAPKGNANNNKAQEYDARRTSSSANEVFAEDGIEEVDTGVGRALGITSGALDAVDAANIVGEEMQQMSKVLSDGFGIDTSGATDIMVDGLASLGETLAFVSPVVVVLCAVYTMYQNQKFVEAYCVSFLVTVRLVGNEVAAAIETFRDHTFFNRLGRTLKAAQKLLATVFGRKNELTRWYYAKADRTALENASKEIRAVMSECQFTMLRQVAEKIDRQPKAPRSLAADSEALQEAVAKAGGLKKLEENQLLLGKVSKHLRLATTEITSHLKGLDKKLDRLEDKGAPYQVIKHTQAREFWRRYVPTETTKAGTFMDFLEVWLLEEMVPAIADAQTRARLEKVFSEKSLRQTVLERVDRREPYGEINCIEVRKAFTPTTASLEDIVLALSDAGSTLAGMQLPALTPSFGGRDDDVAAVVTALRPASPGMHLIVAAGGMGKSLVANAAARHLHATHGGDAVRCDVEACTTGVEALTAIVACMDGSSLGSSSTVASLQDALTAQARLYRSKGWRCVLVVDSAENIGAAGARALLSGLARAVAESQGQMRVVLTSRTALGDNDTTGFSSQTLGPLSKAGVSAVLALVQGPSFSLSAKEQEAIFACTGGNPQQVVALAEMPAEFRKVVLASLAAQQQAGRTDASKGGSGSGSENPEVLQQICKALPARLQHLLSCLAATVVGAFDVEAAASLVGASGEGEHREKEEQNAFGAAGGTSSVGAVSRALQDLASQSWLQALDEDETGANDDDSDQEHSARYRMHDHVRSAVMAQTAVLSEAATVLAKRRYVQHYGNKLEGLDDMYNSKASATALFQFDAERYAYDRAFALLGEMRGETSWTAEEVEWVTGVSTILGCRVHLDEQMTLLEIALGIRKMKLGNDHTDVAATLNNMGLVCWKKGELDRAMKLYEESLRIRKIKLGNDHTSVATTLNNMAIVCENKGELDRAMKLYEESLRIYKIKLGNDHTSVATILTGMAIVCSKKGELDRAMKLFEESLRIYKIKLGNDHTSVADTLNNMAGVYQNKGELDRAMKLYEESLRITKIKLGNDHTSVADTLWGMANIYEQLNDNEKALKSFEESHRIFKAKLGDEHQNTIWMKNGVARVRAKL